jgi:single-stranded DNA-binding protein
MANEGNKKNYGNLALITLVGYLTEDPESKVLPNGTTKVATTSVAINHTDKIADFWKIEIYAEVNAQNGGLHDYAINNLNKGQKVTVVGVPYVTRTSDGKIFPTLKNITSLIGHEDGKVAKQPGAGAQPPAYGNTPQQGYGYPPQGGHPAPNPYAPPAGAPAPAPYGAPPAPYGAPAGAPPAPYPPNPGMPPQQYGAPAPGAPGMPPAPYPGAGYPPQR